MDSPEEKYDTTAGAAGHFEGSVPPAAKAALNLEHLAVRLKAAPIQSKVKIGFFGQAI
jgi:hypothetical protein